MESRIAHGIVAGRRWVIAAWLLLGVVLIPASTRVRSTLDVAARIPGSESARVDELLRTEFHSPFARWAVLVVSGVPSPESSDGDVVLGQIVDSLVQAPGVTRLLSFRDAPDPTLLGAGGSGTFIIVGLDPIVHSPDELIPPLRARTAVLERILVQQYPGAALRWTGEVALNHDLRQTSTAEGQVAERHALPLTLALLLWAFGTVVAALLPIPSALLSIGLSLGAAVLISRVVSLSILLQNVVTMLGLGLGIDYALLCISRFREALSTGVDRVDAAMIAAHHAGKTIALSGCAVAIGFAALVAVPTNELRSMAVGGFVVTAFSVLVSVTLLPALLSWIGPRVDWGRVRRPSVISNGRWLSWGKFIARHPRRVLLIAGAPVLLLAWQAHRLRPALPRGNWLPATMESARGVDDLTRMGRSAVVQSVRLAIRLPVGISPLSHSGWEAIQRAGDSLSARPEIDAVHSLPTLVGGAWSQDLVASISEESRRGSISNDGTTTVIDVVPREGVEAHAVAGLIRDLRRIDGARLTGLAGTRIMVGGLPAFNVDYEDGVNGRFAGVVALVIAGTLIALFVGFRSVLIPIKAVLLNLLSVAGAFGVLVLVFQDGHAAALIGVAKPMDAVFPIVPVLVFCTVFGLSMDYEVFLVSRIAEARQSGASEAEAVAEGLARTGGVITSAAMIMIVVFAAFALGHFVLMKMLGVALATAVLLDATVVRMAIGPALFVLAGRWNWWPGVRTSAAGGRGGRHF